MNNKMTAHSQLSTIKPKKNKNKSELSKQLEQEQIYRNRNHIEGYQRGGCRGGGRMGRKVQGIRSIIGRYEIDRGKLRIVWEMEKPNNLYV